MKNSIKLTALFLFAAMGLFAVAAKHGLPQPMSRPDRITFTSLPSKNGIQIKVRKAEPGKAIIIIYDSNGDVIQKDVLSHSRVLEKGYILDQLEDGDYTIEVTINKQVVKAAVHVYEEGQNKTFIMKN
jgi:hypothetical protein